MSATAPTDDHDTRTESLRAELFRLGCYGAVALAVGAVLLGLVWHTRGALQWIVQAGLIWAFVCYQTARRLPLNKSDSEAPLYRELGWGNRLTLLRACFLAAVAGFLFQPWPAGPVLAWLPGSLYFCGAVLDRVDGYVARKTHHSSLLGNELDMLSDALGLAVASLLAYGYGQVHWTYLLFGVAYYVFHGGIIWRRRQGLVVHPLPPGMHRRAWAGFQMGFLVVALWPWFYPPVTTLAGFAFMLPALLGFIIDWLLVSGRISRQEPATDQFFRRLTHFSQTVLQPAMRVLIIGMLLASLGPFGLVPMSDYGAAGPDAIMSAGFFFASLLILLGIAGRVASLLLIGLLTPYYANNPLQPLDYVLFCSVVWLMLLGTGRFSLWLVDDHWLNRYDGN